jgi:hypothetical protein
VKALLEVQESEVKYMKKQIKGVNLSIKEEISLFNGLTKQMSATFARKRRDYGQTTTETYNKFGPVSMLIRMHDKLGRLDNLLGKAQKNRVVDESIEDTLLDLANYALITILEMRKRRSR